jgi:hypothetical protein
MSAGDVKVHWCDHDLELSAVQLPEVRVACTGERHLPWRTRCSFGPVVYEVLVGILGRTLYVSSDIAAVTCKKCRKLKSYQNVRSFRRWLLRRKR